jgi:hypothetical protein
MIVRRAFVHLVRQGQVGVVRCSSSSSASTAQTREKKSPVSYHIPEKMKAWNLNSYSGLAGTDSIACAPTCIIVLFDFVNL